MATDKKTTSSTAKKTSGTTTKKSTTKSSSTSANKTKTQSSASDSTAAKVASAVVTAAVVTHAVKKSKKSKRGKKVALTIFIILLCIIIAAAAAYYFVPAVKSKVDSTLDKFFGHDDKTPHVHTYGDGDLSIHFLEVGNNYTGDCTYIKAGDIDILIDAGSRQNSAPTIENYVDQYCTDGKLEYVIATHAHQDHIAGFVSTNNTKGIFEYYECETIIDFAQTNATSSIYTKYSTARDEEVAGGAVHYTALQCWNNADGAKRSYQLTDGITMQILYQRFYEESSSDENNYSVCVLFTHGDKNFLLTGDLEKEGEESLASSNDLPEVELFKAGHHGSYTASTNTLLSVIKPKIVCVCCCASSVEYTQAAENTFPSQAFINRVAPYTDAVYVTTLGSVEYDTTKAKYVDTGYQSFNGNIVVACVQGVITVECSNNNTKLKDTAWFAANRDRPPDWAS